MTSIKRGDLVTVGGELVQFQRRAPHSAEEALVKTMDGRSRVVGYEALRPFKIKVKVRRRRYADVPWEKKLEFLRRFPIPARLAFAGSRETPQAHLRPDAIVFVEAIRGWFGYSRKTARYDIFHAFRLAWEALRSE